MKIWDDGGHLTLSKQTMKYQKENQLKNFEIAQQIGLGPNLFLLSSKAFAFLFIVLSLLNIPLFMFYLYQTPDIQETLIIKVESKTECLNMNNLKIAYLDNMSYNATTCNLACSNYTDCKEFGLGISGDVKGDCALLKSGCVYENKTTDWDFYTPAIVPNASDPNAGKFKFGVGQSIYTVLSLGNIGSSYVTCG